MLRHVQSRNRFFFHQITSRFFEQYTSKYINIHQYIHHYIHEKENTYRFNHLNIDVPYFLSTYILTRHLPIHRPCCRVPWPGTTSVPRRSASSRPTRRRRGSSAGAWAARRRANGRPKGPWAWPWWRSAVWMASRDGKRSRKNGGKHIGCV